MAIIREDIHEQPKTIHNNGSLTLLSAGTSLSTGFEGGMRRNILYLGKFNMFAAITNKQPNIKVKE